MSLMDIFTKKRAPKISQGMNGMAEMHRGHQNDDQQASNNRAKIKKNIHTVVSDKNVVPMNNDSLNIMTPRHNMHSLMEALALIYDQHLDRGVELTPDTMMQYLVQSVLKNHAWNFQHRLETTVQHPEQMENFSLNDDVPIAEAQVMDLLVIATMQTHYHVGAIDQPSSWAVSMLDDVVRNRWPEICGNQPIFDPRYGYIEQQRKNGFN